MKAKLLLAHRLEYVPVLLLWAITTGRQDKNWRWDLFVPPCLERCDQKIKIKILKNHRSQGFQTDHCKISKGCLVILGQENAWEIVSVKHRPSPQKHR